MQLSGVVRELYVPLADYPHVRDSATVRDVFATLQEKYSSAEQFRSVLVIDSHDRLVGMLGLRDMLHGLLPDYLRQSPTHFQGMGGDVTSLAMLWQEDCADLCRQASLGPVGPHVTVIKGSLHLDDPLAKGIYMMATTAANILPVVEDHKVIGVLRLVDVVTEVTKAVLHG